MAKPTPLAAFIRQASALLHNDAQHITLVRRRVVVDGVTVVVTVQATAKGK